VPFAKLFQLLFLRSLASVRFQNSTTLVGVPLIENGTSCQRLKLWRVNCEIPSCLVKCFLINFNKRTFKKMKYNRILACLRLFLILLELTFDTVTVSGEFVGSAEFHKLGNADNRITENLHSSGKRIFVIAKSLIRKRIQIVWFLNQIQN